jgi:NADPH-dependent 2,4-dienoyl-CoA reductase/sulfur reductase-like enzyme
MQHYRYLIIGGGMTADAAVRGIRELDADGSIGLITAEDYPPYNRPPLSKGLWKGEPIETIWRDTTELGVELHRGRSVRHVDLHAKQVTDDTGQVYAFDRLLLATGTSPVRLNGTDTDVVYFRTLDDYYRLRERAQQNKRFIVIGGGFIGSELAAALALQGCRVTMLFPEEGIGGRLFPRDLALFLNEYYRERGVEVVPNEKVVALTRGGRGMVQHAPTTMRNNHRWGGF